MSVYHLSYDVKNSEKTDNNEFRKKIVKLILSELKPVWIYRPVASTLYFACAHDIDVVKSVLLTDLKADTYYLLTKIEVVQDCPVRTWLKNPSLAENFAEECKQIMN